MSDAQMAALRIMGSVPRCQESWIGGTVENCDRALERVKEMRAQYATFEPRWMRKEIMGWLDFAENDYQKDASRL